MRSRSCTPSMPGSDVTINLEASGFLQVERLALAAA
jgi:hypothetical protein